LWFGTGVRLCLTDGSLRVAAADRFTLDNLRSRFLADLQDAGRAVTGRVPSVRFLQDAALCRSDDESHRPTGRRCPQPLAATGPEDSPSRARRRRFSSLDQFVVGAGNRVAFTAAGMVAERLGAVSPLFIYGPTGCGKTHLLEGIWSAARRKSGTHRVLFLSAEQFTSMFLEALQGRGLPSFRHKYRNVHLLLVDDVQFFSGKRATLVELQHTIDALLRERRQLVLAGDRSPAELTGFGPELIARMSGGLVCAVEPPDTATRLGIVRHLSERLATSIPHDVLELVATQLQGDARQLAGALNRLEAIRQAYGQPITVERAQSVLLDVFRATHRVVHLVDIDRAVCDVFGLEPSTLQSTRKARVFSQPRALAMWLARKYTRAAYSEIGNYFGRRSHSTVISAQKQVTRWVQEGEAIRLACGECNIDEAIRRVESHIRAG
jgi:chromosomal replication initiator protein